MASKTQFLKLIENLCKIEQFKRFEQNWNDYNAPPFKKEFLEWITLVLRLINHQPEIFPIAGEGIQLEWNNSNGNYLEIDIYDNFHMECLIIVNKQEYEFNLPVNIESISKDINNLVSKFYNPQYNWEKYYVK